MNRPRLTILACLFVCASTSCGAAPPAASRPTPLEPLTLYPLSEGNVWSYDVDTGSGLPTLAITRVDEVAPGHFEVSSGGAPNTYEIKEGGIFRTERGVWLLKPPIREGAEWESASGMTARIADVHTMIDTPAGRFEGCVDVIETGADRAREIRTVYCSRVGPVLVESTMRMDLSGEVVRVTARLRGYTLSSGSSVRDESDEDESNEDEHE